VSKRFHRRSAGRGSRGYTLIELGVVTLLTAVLVFGMIRWLTGVGALAKVGLDDAADGRRGAVAAQIRRDLESVVHCDANGLDARVRELATDTLVFAAQVDDDAAVEIVGWRLNGETLERGESELDAACEGDPANWANWATGVEGFSLASVTAGVEVTAGTAGACESSLLERCQVDAVSVELRLLDDPAVEHLVVVLP
jgi:hypothetical protein